MTFTAARKYRDGVRVIILHRAILSEIVSTLLFSSLGFTVICILAMAFELLRNGVPGDYLLAFLPCLLPRIAVVTLTLGCLFATTLTYSRHASDQEIQAAQWSGVRLGTLAAPALLAGACISLVCVVLNDQAVPAANARLRRLKEQVARELPLLLAAVSEPTFATPTQKMFISGVRDNVFAGIVVMETTNSVTTRILNAREAVVHFDREQEFMTFDLIDGSVDIFDPGPPPGMVQHAVFERYPLRIAFDPSIEIWKDWTAATREEIRQAIRQRLAGGSVATGTPSYQVGEQMLYLGSYTRDAATDVILLEMLPDGTYRALKASRAGVTIDLEKGRLALRLGPGKAQRLNGLVAPRRILSETPFASMDVDLPLDPGKLGLESCLHPSSEQVRKVLRTRVMESQRLWYGAKVELQERMSTALAPLCFVAIGVPLGVWLRHGNRLVSFGASLLVVFALYVPALMAGKQMSLDGLIPAPVGLWLPNALMVVAGLVFGKRIRY